MGFYFIYRVRSDIGSNLFGNFQSRIATQALSNLSSLQSEGIQATNILAQTFGKAALINRR